jgi:alkylhydroperoxidase/carboxymuconolactone decarboxylase family protein YurZ
MPKKPNTLPSGAGRLAERHPEIWEKFSELGKACADAGPLDNRTRHLVKLALAAGAGLEGATHSHVRRARADGVSPEDIHHVALLAIPTLGLPTAVRTLTWMDDILKAEKPSVKRGKKSR